MDVLSFSKKCASYNIKSRLRTFSAASAEVDRHGQSVGQAYIRLKFSNVRQRTERVG